MTGAEIKQALPFLAKYCKDEYNDIRVDEVLLGASDLINRQRAKNEALQMDNEQLQSDIINANMNLEHMTAETERLKQIQSDNEKAFNKMTELYNKAFNRCKTARAEAIKEFAERLKAECRQDRYAIQTSTKFGVIDKQYLRVVDENDIDNLVKEMVGED